MCLIEKAAEIGAHILSGAVMDPKALTELIPDWKDKGAPLDTPVSEDRVLFLSATGGRAVPTGLLPDCFLNHGNYIVRLGDVVKWLGEQAEAAGSRSTGLCWRRSAVRRQRRGQGVATGDMGLTREGEQGPPTRRAWNCTRSTRSLPRAAVGTWAKQLESRFKLREDADPQTYGLGIKGIVGSPAANHKPGLVVHRRLADGQRDVRGGFVYHLEGKLVSVGYVVGLNYSNPYLSPFEEFQRYKTHPEIRKFLEGGKRLAYGARAIAAGGLQSLPKLTFRAAA